MLLINKQALEKCRHSTHKAFTWIDTIAEVPGTSWYKSLLKTDLPYAATDFKSRIVRLLTAYQQLGVSREILDKVVVFDTDLHEWSV